MRQTHKLFRPKLAAPTPANERRGSRHERGYDSEWVRVTADFRRKHATCQECERRGIIVVADVIDHKVPVRLAPDLRLVRKNWWALCNFCHNGLKRRMELLAEKSGDPMVLLDWCDKPDMRPPEVQRMRARKKERRGLTV